MNLYPLEEVFGWILTTSFQASVLTLCVLAVQALLGKRLAPRWRHALWFLVIVQLTLPVALPSPHSIFNWIPEPRLENGAALPPLAALTPAVPEQSQEIVIASPPQEISLAVSGTADPTRWTLLTPIQFAAAIWLLGAAAILFSALVQTAALLRRIGTFPCVDDGKILQCAGQVRGTMHVRRSPVLRQAPERYSPALCGLFRPTLLLPRTLLQAGRAAELRHVLLHEFAHLKRNDIAVNWLLVLLTAAHWFNPVLWFAFHRMRQDREPACDALALRYAGKDEARPYAQTLLYLLEQQRPSLLAPAQVGIFESNSGLKRRITMLLHTRPHRYFTLLPLLLVSVLGYVGLTDAKERTELPETPSVPESAEDPVERPTAVESVPEVQVRLLSREADQDVDAAEHPVLSSRHEPAPIPAQIKPLMESPANIEFEDISVWEIVEFISASWEINIVIDRRAVAPRPKEGRPVQSQTGQMPGIVEYINLKDIPLEAALEALLRPLALDYAFRPGYIWISSPRLLHAENIPAQIGTLDSEADHSASAFTALPSSPQAPPVYPGAASASDDSNLSSRSTTPPALPLGSVPEASRVTREISLNRDAALQLLYKDYAALVNTVHPEIVREESGNVIGITAGEISRLPLADLLGFENGDVLQKIGDLPVFSEADLLEAMTLHQNSSEFIVDFLRDEVPFRYVYKISAGAPEEPSQQTKSSAEQTSSVQNESPAKLMEAGTVYFKDGTSLETAGVEDMGNNMYSIMRTDGSMLAMQESVVERLEPTPPQSASTEPAEALDAVNKPPAILPPTLENASPTPEAKEATEPSPLESKLEAPVSFELEDIHLSEITDFIAEHFDIAFKLDPAAVAAPVKKGETAPPLAPGQASGIVPYIKLNNVQLRQGLEALLRPLGLYYVVEKDRILISSAESLFPNLHKLSSSLRGND